MGIKPSGVETTEIAISKGNQGGCDGRPAFQNKDFATVRGGARSLNDELYAGGIAKQAGRILSCFQGIDASQQVAMVAIIFPDLKAKFLEAADVPSQAVMSRGKLLSGEFSSVDHGRFGEWNKVHFVHHRPPVWPSHSHDLEALLGLRQSQ